MKRINLWIRELSLSQQLLSLVFFVVATFSVFFFMFLSKNVNQFVENELFKLLHNSQNNIIYYLDDAAVDKENTDNNIVHILFYKDLSYTIIGNKSVSEDVISTVKDTVKNHNVDTNDYIYTKGDSSILYTVTNMVNNVKIVSLLSDTYRTEFRNALVNSVININIFVVFGLFVILTLWVGSIIHPLNLIRNYVDKIRKDEKTTLKIDRKDEIGDVAHAILMMEEEISKQNRIKEEMIQNISHDLKTPIATIKSYAESIKDGIYPYGTLEASCDVIIEHSSRLEKKVYSLIMLNKMGYLSDSEPGNNLDMKNLIEKVVISMKAINPDIEIKTNLQNVKFHGEEEPWRIVVENLLDNALRYAKSYVEIKLLDGELCVSNDGINISKDRMNKLFKPYEKGSDGQFGLGLSIVFRVVTTYGYNVCAENLNEGVSFRVYKNGYNKNIVEETVVEEVIDVVSKKDSPNKK